MNRPSSPQGPTPFLPEQALTVALYTTGPAALAYAEADLVVLDKDIFTIPTQQIKDLSVLLTMAGSRVTYATPLKLHIPAPTGRFLGLSLQSGAVHHTRRGVSVPHQKRRELPPVSSCFPVLFSFPTTHSAPSGGSCPHRCR